MQFPYLKEKSFNLNNAVKSKVKIKRNHMNSGYVLSARITGLDQLQSCHFASIARPLPLPELQWIDHLSLENCPFGEMWKIPWKIPEVLFLAAADRYQDGFRREVTSGTVLSTNGKGAVVPGWFSSVNTNHHLSIPHGRQALLTHSCVGCLEPLAMTRL